MDKRNNIIMPVKEEVEDSLPSTSDSGHGDQAIKEEIIEENSNCKLTHVKQESEVIIVDDDSGHGDVAIKEEIIEENSTSYDVKVKEELFEEQPHNYYDMLVSCVSTQKPQMESLLPGVPQQEHPGVTRQCKLTHVKQESEVIIVDDDMLVSCASTQKPQTESLLPGVPQQEHSGVTRQCKLTHVKQESEVIIVDDDMLVSCSSTQKPQTESLLPGVPQQEHPGVTRQSQKGKKKLHSCKYCTKVIKNLSRHLISVHSDEIEVMKYLAAVGWEKRMWYNKMTGKGDYEYNILHPESNIIVKRNDPQTKKTVKLCCTNFKHCNEAVNADSKPEKIKAIADASIAHPLCNVKMKKTIFPKLRDGPIGDLLLTDEMMIKYGNMLTSKYQDEGQEKMILSILRIIGKIVMSIKSSLHVSKEKIESSADCFQPKYYSYFEEAMRELAGAGKGPGGKYLKPSVMNQYAHRFRRFANTVANEHRLSEDKEKLRRVEDWKTIFDTSFHERLGSVAIKQSAKKKAKK